MSCPSQCPNCPHRQKLAVSQPLAVADYMRLKKPVVLVTEGKGLEKFDLVKPLVLRLAELAKGQTALLQMEIGAEKLTSTSRETLLWFLGTFGTNFGHIVKGNSGLITRLNWEKLLMKLDLEFLHP